MNPSFRELVERRVAQPEDSEETNGPMAWVRVTHHDGRTDRWGPYPRWMAELVMGAIAFDPGDIHTSLLEPEPDWVAALL